LLINIEFDSDSVTINTDQHKRLCAEGKPHVYNNINYVDSVSCNLGPQPFATAAGRRKKRSKKLRNIKSKKITQNKK